MFEIIFTIGLALVLVGVCFCAKAAAEADEEIRLSILSQVESRGIQWALAELAITQHNTAKISALKTAIRIEQNKLSN